MATIKQIGVGEDTEKLEHLCTAAGATKWCRAAEHSMLIPQQHTNRIILWASTSIYSQKKPFQAGSQRNICTPTLIATLLVIAKKWKHPECPQTGEWINKTCQHVQWKSIRSEKGRGFWLMLQQGWTLRMLCKVRWASHKKDKYSVIPLVWGI